MTSMFKAICDVIVVLVIMLLLHLITGRVVSESTFMIALALICLTRSHASLEKSHD